MSASLPHIITNLAVCKERVNNACVLAHRNPDSVRIVAASKTQSPEVIRTVLDNGIHNIGENYVQELLAKRSILLQTSVQSDLNWHFIGHLQTKKVREISTFISLIHSVDSLRLATEIGKCAQRVDRSIDILVQVNTSGESSKSGIPPEAAKKLCHDCLEIPHIRLCGLMCIPELQTESVDNRADFKMLREMRDDIRSSRSLEDFTELSMGMSDDFELAIMEGATIVRLGTIIFGARPNPKISG